MVAVPDCGGLSRQPRCRALRASPRAGSAAIGETAALLFPFTSNDVQGLIAQGRTIQETIEIARDVAKKLLESQSGAPLPAAGESADRREEVCRPADRIIVAGQGHCSAALATHLTTHCSLKQFSSPLVEALPGDLRSNQRFAMHFRWDP